MKLSTSCEACYFAQWDSNGEPPYQQSGCRLGRIEQLMKNGVTVEECPETGALHLSEYLCNALRTKEWAESVDNPEKAVREEIAFSCDMIVLTNDRPLIDVRSTLRCIAAQTRVKPASVMVINNGSIDSGDIVNSIKEIFDTASVSWNVTKPSEQTPLFQYINLIQKKFKGSFFSVWRAGDEIDVRFLEMIDYARNVMLMEFFMLEGFDGNNECGLTCWNQAFRQFTNFSPESPDTFEALRIEAVNQNAPHMVKKQEDVQGSVLSQWYSACDNPVEGEESW